MAIGRRGFMAALGLGAAAAPVAGQVLAAKGSGAGMGSAIGGVSLNSAYRDVAFEIPAESPWSARGLTKIAWEALNQDAIEARNALTRYHETAIQGHDPIVFACKSWSPVFGISFTRNKLHAMQTRASELEGKLWGYKE